MAERALRERHTHASGGGRLIPVERARELVLSRIPELSPIALPLQEAYGCVLAENVVATSNLPAFASSAMDGFAVRAADVALASQQWPVDLRVTGEARIGLRPSTAVNEGEAVRIDTGAPIPAGADCIVPIENAEVADGTVRVVVPSEEGRHVRPAAEDAGPGDLLVPSGRKLGAAELGMLAAAGHHQPVARPRPRVVVLSTGNELVEPWQEPGFAQVRDANSFTLYGALREAGAVPFLAGIVRDDVDTLRDTVLSHLVQADVFISSAGVSAGDHDVVKRAFFRRGNIDFFGVAMQPGKPQAFGMIEGKPYFGLPGNPVSVFVSFEVFIRPALMKMMGRRDLYRPEVTAVLDADITGPREKTQFARVRVRRGGEGWVASPTGASSSNLLSTVARANGLAVIPEGTASVRAGGPCRVMLFRSLED